MITETDTVYITIDGQSQILSQSFSSQSELIEWLKDNYEHKLQNDSTIEFGTCDMTKVSDTDKEDIKIEQPNSISLSEDEETMLTEICNRAESDDRIEAVYTNKNSVQHVSKYQQTLKYKNAVDFSLHIQTDLFEDETVSAYDEKQVKRIRTIFSEIVEGNADYLGFTSSYASRGRKDPFTAVYGRINREHPKEAQFRKLYTKPFVVNHLWNDLNISPVRIIETDNAVNDIFNQDYILVLDKTAEDTPLDELSDEAIQSVEEYYEIVVSETDFVVDWIGKTQYYQNFEHICFGISFVPK